MIGFIGHDEINLSDNTRTVADDFSRETVITLAFRAGLNCSKCGRKTSGPRSENNKALNIGEGAHIAGNKPGAARYDAAMESEVRRSVENGIWLCANCHHIVDTDYKAFPVALLHDMKRAAEERAARELDENGVLPLLFHHVLESRPQGFSGRTELLAQMNDLLRQPGARVLLHGEPGNGKSLTALECAWQLCGEFPGVVYLPCGHGRSVEAVGLSLASKLPGIDLKAPANVQIEAARRWLGGRRTLLVLDDVWSDDLRALLPDQPVSLLVTSRQPQRFDIAPKFRFEIPGFSDSEAGLYFAQRLPEYWPAQRDPLLGLWRRFEGSPYALAVASSLLELPARDFAAEVAALSSPSTLKDDSRDVTLLLRRAVEVCGEKAQAFLHSVAFCSPQGVWIDFASRVAGLSEGEATAAIKELRRAALLRLLDQEQGLVGIHSLLREVLQERPMVESSAVWRERQAREVSGQFSAWESNHEGEWQNCHRILEEGPRALDWLQEDPDPAALFALSNRMCHVGWATGQLTFADAAIRRFCDRARVLGDLASLQSGLGNQALILQDWGRLDEAMAHRKDEESIARSLEDRAGLSRCLGNQAVILQAWGRLEGAMALHKEEERICRELGDRSGLNASLGNQALILQDWGRLEEAMVLHKEEERICLELGDRAGLQASLGNQALILKAWGRLDEAMALHKEQERICRELGDRAGLARSLGNQALLHAKRQPADLASARKLTTEALQIFTELGMPRERDQVQRILDSLG
jgi:tetratricopeptide (TPR) repeat protein/DNA polymerase III delta prime subunit